MKAETMTAVSAPSTTGGPIIETRDLRKEYRLHRQSVPVLKGVSLRIEPGEILAILGRSGAGKSTLLNLLGLLDAPTTGDIFLRGQEISRLSLREKARIRNGSFGFVFQFYHLLPDLSVLENVLLPSMIFLSGSEFRRRRAELTQRADEILERVGILERRDFLPNRLSGGERQRAAIARALVNKPGVVYCDEPTGNLDRGTGETILGLLLELNQKTGTTFVIVTHDEELARHAHRRLYLEDGRFNG